jgi:two-component system response regulator
VRVARDGAGALEALFGPRGEGSDFRPRLILLDLKLPGMDGFEVLQCIKSNPDTRLIPVVILSSSGHQRDIEEAYRLGANGYVVKPVDFGRFIETVQILCNYWLTHNRAAHNSPLRA